MAPSARTTERLTLAAGALALAASPFLPLLPRWVQFCPGWTCYVPAAPGSHAPRPISGPTPWDTRPSLAMLLVAAAALAVVVGWTVRDLAVRRVAAAGLVLTVALLVADTARLSGHVLLHRDVLFTSASLALPVAGGLIAALTLASGPAAQRGT